MSFINSLYQKSVADNDKNLRFWEDYLKSLKALDFSTYADKLKVPTLVPIGSRVFFRGELKHTNEVTIAIGADYFVKCSLAQAEILRQHRIKDAETKLKALLKEKEYLENQVSQSLKSLYENESQEIVEVFTEEEDKAWREKHKANVRKYKQGKAKEKKPKETINDEDLWMRLEELELEEELENELLDNYNEIGDKRKENLFVVKEELTLNINKDKLLSNDPVPENKTNGNKIMIDKNIISQEDKTKTKETTQSKLVLLQQVLDKQNQLEDKLLEIKNRDRLPSKTENELMSRLDEIEQLDELEDEIDRLDGILETENVDSDDEEINIVKTSPTKLKKSISFADNVDDNSKTIDITFKHSDIEPNNEPYDPVKGISKPNDIYERHSLLFNNKPTSILKKSKYDSDFTEETLPDQVNYLSENHSEIEVYPVKNTIVVKDVIENPVNNRIKTEVRPTSLFKKRRMQNKS